MSDRNARPGKERDRAVLTGIWERVGAELGRKPLDAKSIAEILSNQILQTKYAATLGGYRVDAISIPIAIAWQIIEHLKRTPPGKGGRRPRSWDEVRAFKTTVVKAQLLKAKLIKEKGLSPTEAENEAAATYGAERSKGRKRRAGQRYAADTILRAMQMKPR
jgi:hypothetical protein